MDLKLMSEKLIEKYDEDIGMEPLQYQSQSQQFISKDRNSSLGVHTKLEMYDNENRNLRAEREKLLDHIKKLEAANQTQEKALSFLSTQQNGQLTQKLLST